MENQSTQENVSPSTDTNKQPLPEKKKLNWKGFILALVIVGVLDIGALTVIHNDTKEQIKQPVKPTQIPLTPTVTTTVKK